MSARTEPPEHTISGALFYFALLTPEQQALAVRKLANAGWSDADIAVATKLATTDVRRILAEPTR